MLNSNFAKKLKKQSIDERLGIKTRGACPLAPPPCPPIDEAYDMDYY